ncbi:MAG: LysM peptidoglycan-binding domain-containing protein [Oscillospiraceae bacterium]|nr:LysM peptidoglycan-binding domain-containing protein [Oscillospiraceae bacterium]
MFIYTVQPGDNLSLLSRRFDVPVSQIAADNGLSSPNNLAVGQNLVIMSDIMRYRVEEGQTMYSIAREFEIPLNTLLEANPDVNPIALQIGDEILIPQQRELSLRPAVINGYAYPTITDYALNCALPSLTFLSPFSYSISPRGEIFAPNDDAMIEKARNAGVMPLMTVTNIYEGTFSTEVMSEILADTEARENMISNILAELAAKDYYGLNLDIEYISPDDRESYNSFLREISERLHTAGYILVTAVAPKYRADQQGILYESHDYAVQGEAADYVVIMTYEWGYTYSSPMSVQPIEEVRKVLSYAVTEIPSEKILMGMPNYGYDWTLPYTRGEAASSIGFTAATELATRYNSEILYDEKTQTPYFYYTENGVRHVVWFDDPRSIEAKLGLVEKFDLAGVSYWTVNRCYIPNWLVAQSMFEPVKL